MGGEGGGGYGLEAVKGWPTDDKRLSPGVFSKTSADIVHACSTLSMAQKSVMFLAVENEFCSGLPMERPFMSRQDTPEVIFHDMPAGEGVRASIWSPRNYMCYPIRS